MQTKFKRHQPVIIRNKPSQEFIEYHNINEDESIKPEIKSGMKGKINILLPNGQYHVEILDNESKTIAYAPFNEEDLEEDLEEYMA